MAVSLGCAVDGVCLPHPDPKDDDTLIAGAEKRIVSRPPDGKLPPPLNRKLKRRFREFVRRWIRKNLTPVSPDEDLSFDTWIKQTQYPDWRKAELRIVHETLQGIYNSSDPELIKVKCFMKDEFYNEFKHARGIYSRVDYFKVLSGPYFKVIENQLYKHPSFIKHVPVRDRPQYIKNMLFSIGARYVATDYTAFESLFTKEMMEMCEFELYRYMFKHHRGAANMEYIMEVLSGWNICQYKNFSLLLRATRMSGEMNTSLGNGFSNLMFMLFVCHESGSKNVRGVVEGDDGLFTFSGRPPDVDLFKELNLRIKFEIHDDLSTASFCGIIFDTDECINICDVAKSLVSFGWTSGKYQGSTDDTLKTLLRCKAMSVCYQYPSCPVLDVLGRKILELTDRGLAVNSIIERDRSLNVWDRQKLREAARWSKRMPRHRECGIGTRVLLEKKFGLSVENQLIIESTINEMKNISTLTFPTVIFKEDWVKYSSLYVTNSKDASPGPFVCEHRSC